MLSEFDEIEQRYGAEKGADLRRACRYLLRHQFAFSGRGVVTIYNTLTDSRFRQAADGLFDSLGYRVVRNSEEQWVGILLDDDDPAALPKLRLDETIVLLVVASHWQDDADRGDLQHRATAVTTANTLHERYRDLVQSAGKLALPFGRFLYLLREFAHRNLIEIGEFDRDRQDHEVTIRSIVKLVSGDTPLRLVEAYIRSEEVSMRPALVPVSEAVAHGAGGA